MPTVAFAIPVLPGKTDQLRQLARDLRGSRRAEYDRVQLAGRITHEDWYLQESPDGSLLIGLIEGQDVAATMKAFAESQDPFELWEKQQLFEISGLDFNQTADDPLPTTLMEWREP
jgi:hypothetical protein